MASSSTPGSVDVEKTMKNFKLKEKVVENFKDSVTEAGDSSSSLTPKEEEDVMDLKNLKIQETVQSSKFVGEGSSKEMKPKSTVLLRSSDGDIFEVEKSMLPQTIKHMIVDGDEITLTSIPSWILEGIVNNVLTLSCFVGSVFVGEGSSKMKPKSVVFLRSSEGDVYQVEESIAMLSQTIKHMIEDGVVAGDEIPLTDISSWILVRVLVFLEKHAGDEEDLDEDEKQELKKWDEKFVQDLKNDLDYLCGIILAANFLGVRSLLDVACQTCAGMLKGNKSPEWIKECFGIKNDFTPKEEEEEVRAEAA